MDSNRFARLGEIFAHARDLAPDARAEYLREACAGDEELHTEVEELLSEDAHWTNSAVDRALSSDGEFGLSAGDSRPKYIGKYRILGICGSGGMGTVYEAEQESPSRRVALKVIQAGALRPDLLSRFRRETQILARLQHPCIAQIFEAGEFEGGTRPFFAMEFVEGEPLVAYAKRRGLDVAARIEIFVKICDAIHYAHQQGVVHRDLKPDNIFVVETTGSAPGAKRTAPSASGQPKILDFGVARVTDSDAPRTLATGAGALLGSVAYMSPEQASGSGAMIDARSDLYTLGVVLFELLTGELPYDVRQRPLAGALHAILHDEPTRLGTADRGLHGDLGTIVGKCLEKDKRRRYETVAALGEDLRRFSKLETISARPPTTWYQLQKFTQRNRALVGGTLATVAALLAGAIVAVVFALQSSESARVARDSQVQAEHQAYRANLLAATALLETDPAQAGRILAEIPGHARGWEHRYLSAALSGFLLEFGEVAPRGSGRLNNRQTGDMYLLSNGEHVIARRSADEFDVLETRTGRVLRSFRAPEPVLLFAVARGGSLLAAVLESGRVAVADPGEERPTWATWWTADGEVDALAVDPAGERIAIERAGELRFGRPGAWHSVATPGVRNYFAPAELEFSPDGTRLASLLVSIHLYDTATGEPSEEPIESSQGIWSFAFSPNGERIAGGHLRRGHRRGSRAAGGRYDTQLLGHNAIVIDVAWGGPKRLLSVSVDGTIRVWDLELGKQIAIFDAPGTTKAEFVDDDHVLSLTGGRFRLWTMKDRRARELVGHKGHVFVPVFSGDGGLLATSAPWEDVIVWDPLETTPLRRFPSELMSRMAFDRAGEELLVSGAYWSRFLVRSPWMSGERIAQGSQRRGFHHGTQGADELLVDGASVSAPQGVMRVFRTEHRARQDAAPTVATLDGVRLELEPGESAPVPGPHPLLTFGDLFSYGFKGSIVEWIAFDGSLSPRAGAALDAYLAARLAGDDPGLPYLDGAPKPIAHFRADEESVSRNEQGFVVGWTARNDADLRLTPRGRPPANIVFVPAVEDAPARVEFDSAFASNRLLETELAEVAGLDTLTVCWLGSYASRPGGQTGYSIATLHVPYADSERDERIGKVGGEVSFSADGRLVAETSSHEESGPVTVRDTATGVSVATFEGAYWGLDFHPDSQLVACGSEDGSIDVFDVRTKERVVRIPGHTQPCYDVAFSPDGTRLASAGNDNALRLWDAETYEPLLEFPGHRSYVRGLAWSPDGSMLVSTSGDYGVRVWDSVSRVARYRQVLANRALADEVRAEVESIHRTFTQPQEAIAELRRRWSGDEARRHAALKVLARLE